MIGKMFPKLREVNPSYFRLVNILVLVHLAIFIDFIGVIGDRHTAPVFVIVSALIPLTVQAMFHLFSALFLIYGTFRDIAVLRWGLRVSVTLYWVLSGGWLTAALLDSRVALTGTYVFAALALLASATLKQPVTCPIEESGCPLLALRCDIR